MNGVYASLMVLALNALLMGSAAMLGERRLGGREDFKGPLAVLWSLVAMNVCAIVMLANGMPWGVR